MNQKRAKHYRRIARERTIGQPNRVYVRSAKGRHLGMCVTLHPNCTRAEYKRIKAEHRRGGAL